MLIEYHHHSPIGHIFYETVQKVIYVYQLRTTYDVADIHYLLIRSVVGATCTSVRVICVRYLPSVCEIPDLPVTLRYMLVKTHIYQTWLTEYYLLLRFEVLCQHLCTTEGDYSK